MNAGRFGLEFHCNRFRSYNLPDSKGIQKISDQPIGKCFTDVMQENFIDQITKKLFNRIVNHE